MASLNESYIRGNERAKATARVKAILSSEEAKGRKPTAEHLAYNTTQSPEDAIALLRSTPKETAGLAQKSWSKVIGHHNANHQGGTSPATARNGEASSPTGWNKVIARRNASLQAGTGPRTAKNGEASSPTGWAAAVAKVNGRKR